VPVQQEQPASIRDEVEFTRLNRDMNTMGNLGMLSAIHVSDLPRRAVGNQ